MKKILTVLICLMLSPSIVNAKEFKKKPAQPPAEFTLPEKECDYLLSYQPSPDTEYQPGIDVHGKPVMEADLTPQVVKPPEVYNFVVTVDIARYLGLAMPEGTEGNVPVGMITIEKDGHIFFNGNPLEGDEEAALKAICTRQKAEKEKKIDPKSQLR